MSKSETADGSSSGDNHTQTVTLLYLYHNLDLSNCSTFKLFLHSDGVSILHGGYCMTSAKWRWSSQPGALRWSKYMTHYLFKYCRYFQQVWCWTWYHLHRWWPFNKGNKWGAGDSDTVWILYWQCHFLYRLLKEYVNILGNENRWEIRAGWEGR